LWGTSNTKVVGEHYIDITTLAWIGGEFDPEVFDLDEVNVELQRLTPSEVR